MQYWQSNFAMHVAIHKNSNTDGRSCAVGKISSVCQ